MNTTINVNSYNDEHITLTLRNESAIVTFTYTRGEEDSDGSNFTGWYWDGDDLLEYTWADIITNVITAHPHNGTAQRLTAIWDTTDLTEIDRLNAEWEKWAIKELRTRIDKTIGYITHYTINK